MKKTKFQKGVVCIYEDDVTVDIDVEPWVNSVIIYDDMEMESVKKSFPNVKKLIIKKDVQNIHILNTLFPNVERVQSESFMFESGPYLIRRGRILLNTFCKKESETMNLAWVASIAKKAFYKCNCLNVKNMDALSSCEEAAFDDSALMAQPFKNGVKMAGNLLIAIDETAEEVILPDEHTKVHLFAADIDLSKIKKLVVHDIRSLEYVDNVPSYVVLDGNPRYDIEIEYLAHLSKGLSYVDKLVFTDKVKDFKESDGVIYGTDGLPIEYKNVLVAALKGTKFVVVQEGVDIIAPRAFLYCNIKSIVLSDSVKKIGYCAFEDCNKLEYVKLGNGLAEIEEKAFIYCINLRTIELPPQMRIIKEGAFIHTGLESVKLNEGLKVIEKAVFYDTQLNDIDVPASVEKIGQMAFGINIQTIRFKKYFQDIMTGFVCISGTNDLNTGIVKLECDDKAVYVPRYVRPDMYTKMNKRLFDYFNRKNSNPVEFWDCAHSVSGRENMAILEYGTFSSHRAGSYLRRNARRVILRLLEEGDEKRAITFLKFGFIPNLFLKNLVLKTNEQMTIQAYILEQLKDNCDERSVYSL